MKKYHIVLAALIASLLMISVFYFLDIFVMIAIWAGISISIAMTVFIVGFVIVSILAVPYYLFKKDKEVQDHGSYDIDDIEGKE
ncbi:MAG: hypothetical protein KGY76_07380 [Candidatus Thermoplasmatota archaeon]|nr:hypothetical protein [Candidatus Thermoplasmatota archaeon]